MYCKAFCKVFTFDTRFVRMAIDGIARRRRTKASFTARTRNRSRAFRFSTDTVDSGLPLDGVAAEDCFGLKLLRLRLSARFSFVDTYVFSLHGDYIFVYSPAKHLYLFGWNG